MVFVSLHLLALENSLNMNPPGLNPTSTSIGFLAAAALRRYVMLIGMNILPLSIMRVWLLRLCGVTVGADCYVGFGVMVDTNYPNLIKIGNHVTISHGCTLVTHTQSPVSYSALKKTINDVREIVIHDGSWLGLNVILLPGAIVRTNCLIGAGSVVPALETKANSLYAGNPARFKKYIHENILTDNCEILD